MEKKTNAIELWAENFFYKAYQTLYRRTRKRIS